MIVPDISHNAAAVADHYDELDPIYRRVWSEHIHHGLWVTRRETPAEAHRVLSPGGRFVVCAWLAGTDGSGGAPEGKGNRHRRSLWDDASLAIQTR